MGKTVQVLCMGLTIFVLAACQPVSEPWVSGAKAKRLQQERTRTAEQSDVLRERLKRYGSAYQ